MENYKLLKKASIEQGIHNRHQKTTKTVRVAGIIAAILLLSCVLALLPQSAQASTLTTTVTVGDGPSGVAVTPNGLYVYVTNNYGNTVSVISTATNTVTSTITGFNYPNSVAVAPNGTYAYVTNYSGNTVSVISTATNTVTSTITGFNYPNSVAVAPNGTYAYVTNYSGNTVSVISTATNTVTSTITGLNYAEAVAVSPNGEFIYVKHSYDQNQVLFSVINTTTNTITATVTLNGYPNFSSGGGSSSVAVAPDGKSIYVVTNDYSNGNLVSVINATTNTVTNTITLGGMISMYGSGSGGVAITPNGAYAYVTSSDYMSGNSVSVINTTTNTVTETILLGGSSYYMGGGSGGVAITPNGAYAYATSGGYMSNTVSVVSTSGIDTFAITISQGDHGTISPGTTTVNYGGSQEFTFTPATGYHIVAIIVNGTTVGTTSPYTVSTVTGATSLTAEFAINTYAITVTQGDHGTISPSTTTVNYGGSQEFTFTPATGYHIVAVIVNGSSVGTTSPYTVSTVTGATSLTAEFAINTYAITVTQGDHGTISPSTTTVNYGGSQEFTFTPATGYHIVAVIVNGSSVGTTSPYTVSTVTGATSLTAEFAINTYAITVTQGDHGTISPSTTTVNYGGSQEFTFTPATGYHIVAVIVNGSSVGTTSPYTVSTVTGATSLTAEFAINTYAITVSQGDHGTISPSTTTVNYGGSQEFTFTPATGYHIVAVIVNGSSVGTTSPYTVSTVTGATSLTAEFAINTYAITVSQGDHGTISPSTTTVNYGGSQEFTFTPATGYHIVAVIVNGSSVGTTSPYTVSTVTGATSLTAEFAINTYAITVSQGDHGTISPSTTTVNYGSTQEFTITPHMGYHISSLVVDGSAVTVASTYNFSNVQDDHSITASFTTNTLTATVTTTSETYPIEISGNITTEQFSNMTITPYQDTKTTIVEFTLTGPNGTEGFCNLTLPKIAIPFGTNPIVYIDGTVAENQSFTEDSDNFYITYTTHFSTHQIEISFTTESNPSYIPIPITNWAPSQTSNTSPNPTKTPTANPTSTPTSTIYPYDFIGPLPPGATRAPAPTTSPTTSPTPTQTPMPNPSSMSLNVPVIAAMILIGLVLIGLLVKRRQNQQNN